MLVLGDINLDLNWALPYYPSEGDDCTADKITWSSGGAGVNAATMFARLGAQTTLLGCIGSDPAAPRAIKTAREAGVNIEEVQIDPHIETGLCSVAVTNTQRTFFSSRGANINLKYPANTESLLAQKELLYISSHALLTPPQQDTTERIIQEGFAKNIRIALDLGLPPIRQKRQKILKTLKNLWLLSLNQDELKTLFPNFSTTCALKQILEHGVLRIALKLGAQGCILADSTGQYPVPGMTAIKVRDTTACGDAFAAGLAWALIKLETEPDKLWAFSSRLKTQDRAIFDQYDQQQLKNPLRETGKIANFLGALTATRPGGADSLPRLHSES